MTNKFLYFIWDFDGTLFDTYPIYNSSIQKVIKKNTFQGIKTEKIERVIREHSLGYGLKLFANQFNVDEDKFRAEYSREYSEHFSEAKPFSGASKTLRSIVNHGGNNFLITHNDETALTLLQAFDLKNYFSDFVLGDSGFKRKPDPGSINYLIDKFKLPRKETVYIGDRELDIQAAHNSEIKGIFFAPNNLIEVSDFDVKINKLVEIENYLK